MNLAVENHVLCVKQVHMLDIEDLIAATLVDDQPAMAKIIDKMSKEELMDFRIQLRTLYTIAGITLRHKLGTPIHD